MIVLAQRLLRLNAQETAKKAWHGFMLVSKNIEGFLQGTPFQTPFAIFNTLSDIANVRITLVIIVGLIDL